MSDLSRFPALIFDLDGTLIDSAPDIHACANKIFVSKGLEPFAFDVVKGFIGNGVGVLVSRLLQSRGLPSDGTLHAEMVSDFVNIYEEAFDLTTVYPGAPEALEALAAVGFQMGVCTNKPQGPARAALRHFGLDRHIRSVIGGDSLATRKPDPAPLLAAIAGLDAPRGILVGDSEVDAATAKAAGVSFALFTQGYRKAPVESLGAKLIFDDYRALPGLLSHVLPRL